MYAALALIMVALAGSSVVATRSAGRRGHRVGDQLTGFVYIGAGALVLLAAAVLVLGLVDDRGARAEGLAMFTLFTYAIYLLAAFVIQHLTDRRRA
ncbi:MAG: hypothetical protein ABWX96_21200 [Propionibacteriaceae bacterium]